MRNSICEAEDVLEFWFKELKSKDWFSKVKKLDEKIRKKFGATHSAAVRCELLSWRKTPRGRLAEIIVIDQFSRNIFRDNPLAFSADPLALALAQEAIHSGDDSKISVEYKAFLYMPYMHSESPVIHELAMKLFSEPGLEHNFKIEVKHKKIIDRFGRYPHRNEILQRQSTPEEIEFLKEPNSSF